MLTNQLKNQKETRMEATVPKIDNNSNIGIPAPEQELTSSA